MTVVGEGRSTVVTVVAELKVAISNPNNYIPATVTLAGGLKGRRVQGNSTEGYIVSLGKQVRNHHMKCYTHP